MPVLRKRIHFWLAGALGSRLLRLLCATWRIRLVDPHRVAERARGRRSPLIVAFWHRQIMSMMLAYRGHPFCVPVSEHRDGEYTAHVMERLGYLAVRGSSTRGAPRLLRDVLGAIRDGWSCAITPDGPVGPRFSVQPGFIMLARRVGIPVYPVGVAADRAWVMKSWDAFVVPKPRAKIVIVLSDPLSADELAGGQTDALCAALKDGIRRATEQARMMLAG